MGRTKRAISEVYEEETQNVGLNISAEKTKAIISNGKTRRRINEI
jgi:hypothetical protein